MEIKNLKKAASRILDAVRSKERVILYGDADMDGAASVIILKETIRNLGGQVSAVYFPDREVEGYGISKKGLDYLKKFAPALLITLDCGIGNFREVRMAKKLGFEVIIIDHHEALDKLPEASVTVDPKQGGDKYPFKGLATVGIIYKLSELLLKNKLTGLLEKSFLELTAIATIADMMPREADNKIFIKKGLSSLENSPRPGLRVLFNLEPFRSLPLPQKIDKINSLLNIRNVKNRLPAAFRILTASDEIEVENLAKSLLKEGIKKKERIKEITTEIEKAVSEKSSSPIIFEGSNKWKLVFLGTAASIISQKYQKPVFLYKRGKTESQGSIRAPAGFDFDVVKTMKDCSGFLQTYGGHPLAAGFSVKTKNLEKLKNCLIRQFSKCKK